MKIRRERTTLGGPTYPDYHHVWWSDPTSMDDSPEVRRWLEHEATEAGGRLVVHLGLHSIGEIIVVEPEGSV